MKKLLLLFLLVPLAASAQTVYDFVPASGIEGSVTLTSATTTVLPSDILSFNFTGLLSGTTAGCIGVGCGMTVSNGNLYWTPRIDISGSENLDGYYGTVFENATTGADTQAAFILTDDPYVQGAPSDYDANTGELLATDPPVSSVPEISGTGALDGILLLLGMTAILSRPRRG